MRSNMMVDQKLVMAHVFGHCDFSRTTRGREDRPQDDGSHGESRHRDPQMGRPRGIGRVERFLDGCLSLDNLVDPHSMFIQRKTKSVHPPRPARSRRK